MIENIAATKQFGKDYAIFARNYPTLRKTFADFIKMKVETNGTALFGKKDGPLLNANLRGFMHAHMVFGKAVLIYRVEGETFWLVRIIDHVVLNATGAGSAALGRYLQNLSAADFSPHSVDDSDATPKKILTPAQVGIVRDTFYEMAAHPSDRVMLRSFVDGSNTEAMEFVIMALELEWPEAEIMQAIEAAFGGSDGLRRIASKALMDMIVEEEVSAMAARLAGRIVNKAMTRLHPK
jgi:mRNA-degrading endonuclease YafQ of YafQ-DinJ toxin-antitoxin module